MVGKLLVICEVEFKVNVSNVVIFPQYFCGGFLIITHN